VGVTGSSWCGCECLHPGLSAALLFNGTAIAYFGVLQATVRKAIDIDQVCAGFEILLEALPAKVLCKQSLCATIHKS